MKAFTILTVLLMLVVSLGFATTVATKTLKKHHSDLTCFDCHAEENPTHSLKVTCAPCHNIKDVAAKTEKKHKEYYDPHNPLHYGEYALCENCHREHTPSRLECNNPNCHTEFKYTVP